METEASATLAAWKQSVEWRRERMLMFSKGSFASAAGIVSPLLAAVLSSDSNVQVWEVVVYFAGAAAAAAAGTIFAAAAAQCERDLLVHPDRQSTSGIEKVTQGPVPEETLWW
jgi:hypothetical protein